MVFSVLLSPLSSIKKPQLRLVLTPGTRHETTHPDTVWTVGHQVDGPWTSSTLDLLLHRPLWLRRFFRMSLIRRMGIELSNLKSGTKDPKVRSQVGW